MGHEDGESLAHCLKRKPTEFVPICERALQELYQELVKADGDGLSTKAPTIQLQFTCDVDLEGTFGTMKPMMIRDLTSDQVESLVVVQGIVISARRARHKARIVTLKCSNCEICERVRLHSTRCRE